MTFCWSRISLKLNEAQLSPAFFQNPITRAAALGLGRVIPQSLPLDLSDRTRRVRPTRSDRCASYYLYKIQVILKGAQARNSRCGTRFWASDTSIASSRPAGSNRPGPADRIGQVRELLPGQYGPVFVPDHGSDPYMTRTRFRPVPTHGPNPWPGPIHGPFLNFTRQLTLLPGNPKLWPRSRLSRVSGFKNNRCFHQQPEIRTTLV